MPEHRILSIGIFLVTLGNGAIDSILLIILQGREKENLTWEGILYWPPFSSPSTTLFLPLGLCTCCSSFLEQSHQHWNFICGRAVSSVSYSLQVWHRICELMLVWVNKCVRPKTVYTLHSFLPQLCAKWLCWGLLSSEQPFLTSTSASLWDWVTSSSPIRALMALHAEAHFLVCVLLRSQLGSTVGSPQNWPSAWRIAGCSGIFYLLRGSSKHVLASLSLFCIMHR